MSQNVIEYLVGRHPSSRVVVVVSSEPMKPEALATAVRGVIRDTQICEIYASKGNCWNFVIVEDSETTRSMTARDVPNAVKGSCLPSITFSAGNMIMYLVSVQDLITLQTMTDHSNAWMHDISDVVSGNTKIQMPGVDLMPIAFGHSMTAAVGSGNSAISILAKTVMLPMLFSRGISVFPKGFEKDIGVTFVIAPNDDNHELFDMSFLHKDEDDEEFLGVSIEQMFALYESRVAAAIQ